MLFMESSLQIAEGDDILVFEDENRINPSAVLHTLRQQENKSIKSCII